VNKRTLYIFAFEPSDDSSRYVLKIYEGEEPDDQKLLLELTVEDYYPFFEYLQRECRLSEEFRGVVSEGGDEAYLELYECKCIVRALLYLLAMLHRPPE